MIDRTIAAGAAPRINYPQGESPSIFSDVNNPSEEKGEKAIKADPKLGRSVFLYMEPRQGIDGKDTFAQCASCRHFITEQLMHGAVRGDRCELFGDDFPISGGDSCGLYCPTDGGSPAGCCDTHNAEHIIHGTRGAIRPYQAGYVSNQAVRCSNCRFYDFEDGDCEFFEGLNASLPDVFDLDKEVKADGCCNAFEKPDPPKSVEF